jgi:hypothetical protein
MNSWPFRVCLFALVKLLLVGYGLAGHLPAGFALSLVTLCGWAALRFQRRWLPSTLLVISVCGAAGGLLADGSPFLMVAVISAALACWELAGRPENQKGAILDPPQRVDERAHLILLVFSTGLGLFLAEMGLLVKIRLPFVAVLLAALLALFGLYQFYRSLQR